MDIATLQETRLTDSGALKEKELTFFCHEKRAEDRREHGIGFAVRNTLLSMAKPVGRGCESPMTLLVSILPMVPSVSLGPTLPL